MLVASVAHTAFRRSVGVSAGNPTISTRTLPTLRTIFLQETDNTYQNPALLN